MPERQITIAPHGHILTNVAVWSRDGRRIVYDVRSDHAGDIFDGDRIETIDVETGEVRVLYRSRNGAKCGVATYDPTSDRVVFILGPEDPTPAFSYGPSRRRGVMVFENRPGEAIPLDARDLSPPFTPGALRGGSHVHVFSPDGRFVSFTYEDHVLSDYTQETSDREINLRNVGVSILGRPVHPGSSHPRNHDGTAFSVLVTTTTETPRLGSDEIKKAFEESWIGQDGYRSLSGGRRRAIAFQGHVVTPLGETIAEVFIASLPDDLTVAGDGPLEGTETTRPQPPRGTAQRRLTHTANRLYPGIQGPRHWLRSSPDGSRIAFLMKDDEGIVQLWTISPLGGQPIQVTKNTIGIGSAFTWNADGSRIAHVMGTQVCVTDAVTGSTTPLTPPTDRPPRSEAAVFSPDGRKTAYLRTMPSSQGTFNQIFICDVPQ